MKAKLSTSNLTVAAILAVVVLAIAFWALALSPKKDEAAKLGKQVEQLKASLAQHQAEVEEAEAARAEFPVNYQKLVVLGKAAPGDDDTASLLVQVNRIAKGAKVRFSNFELSEGGEAEAEAETPAAAPASGGPVSATEAEAALLPLGATIGPAGLGVMPYNLTFSGDFFQIADFIKGLDSLVETSREEVTVDGRLLTIDGFSLEADPQRQFPALQATFSVTTYLTPPGEGITGGATPEGVGAGEAAPVSTTTGGGVAR
jgi:Tfp pilus assembly protein PilO